MNNAAHSAFEYSSEYSLGCMRAVPAESYAQTVNRKRTAQTGGEQ